MKTSICCKQIDYMTHAFYLMEGGNEYFLFNQKYRMSIAKYFRRNLSLNEALDSSRAHKNPVLIKTMKKLPLYIKRIEKEYGIAILEQTKNKCRKSQMVCASQLA